MKLAYDFYRSMLLINPRVTKEIFLEKSGAKSGFALEMFSRMYDAIFSELIDVDREFDKYYSFEYETLENFLYKKYNVHPNDLQMLMEERKKWPECILYRKDDYSYGDYGLGQFIFSDTMYDRTFDILMLKK